MPRDDVSREFAYQIAGYIKAAGKTDLMEGSTEELQRRGRMRLRKAQKGSDDLHSYWFVMNAFLLRRPMYEDSRYRMKTRFIGTAAGCILITIILYFCNASVFHLLIAGIMVICMYTATPGTITHAAFVTCF